MRTDVTKPRQFSMEPDQRRVMRFVRQFTNDSGWGVKESGPSPRFVNPMTTVAGAMRGWGFTRKMARRDYALHFEGANTAYFSGASRGRKTLVMFDIDVQKSLQKGTQRGAWEMAEHLKSLLPGLYCEASTAGSGVHGYFILDREDRTTEESNALLDRLDAWAAGEAKRFDVENAEVKGKALVVLSWNKADGPQLKFGTLAKVPREWQRADEIVGMCEVTHSDIESLVGDAKPARKQRARSEQPRPLGSTLSVPVPAAILEALPTFFLPLAEANMAPIQTSGTNVVRAEDLAIFLMLLVAFSLRPNPDGSMPYERFRTVWGILYDYRLVSRAFDPSRYSAMWAHATRSGFIDVLNPNYQVGHVDDDGQYEKGYAAKWLASPELLQAWSNRGSTGAIRQSFHVIFCRAAAELAKPIALVRKMSAAWWDSWRGRMLEELYGRQMEGVAA